jgi:homoserine O-acetyltransferase
MSDNAYYGQDLHGPYETFDLGDFGLEDGGTIRGAFIAYATHGTLSPAKDNAILVATWYSGTSKIMEQTLVGPGRALDPSRYFIIIANQLGSGLSSSPHNTSGPFHGPDFPSVRIGDDVRAQHKLVTEKFGLSQLQLVTGGSMGAQQTYEWAARYPDFVRRAAPIAGTARNKPHCGLIAQSFIDAMTSDPAFRDGYYKTSDDVRQGLVRHARAFAVTGLCQEFFKQELWRSVGFTSLDDFLVGFLGGYFLPMDPNNLILMARKWQRGDVSRLAGGDLAAALKRVKAKTTVMALSTDMFFPPADVEDDAKLVPGARFKVIQTSFGHAGLFSIEPTFAPQVDAELRELLAQG